MRPGEIVWPLVGSLVIASGAALAGLYAFEGDILIVMIGFLIFIGGYRLSQVGVHGGTELSDLSSAAASVEVHPRSVSRAGLLVVGWIGIASGVTLFSQTILDPSPTTAAISGIASIGGYMCAHVGINGVGLGDSFLKPVLEWFGGTSEKGEQE